MEVYIGPLISAVSVVLVALIEGAAARERKRARADRERVERRAAVRERESRLSMELMAASCSLSLVAAKKLMGMHTNGDVEEAMEKARAAQEDYKDFVRDIASKQVCKA